MTHFSLYQPQVALVSYRPLMTEKSQGQVASVLGIILGEDFSSPVDNPHFSAATAKMVNFRGKIDRSDFKQGILRSNLAQKPAR